MGHFSPYRTLGVVFFSLSHFVMSEKATRSSAITTRRNVKTQHSTKQGWREGLKMYYYGAVPSILGDVLLPCWNVHIGNLIGQTQKDETENTKGYGKKV